MVVVAITALDFAATRALISLRSHQIGTSLLVGALPMANVLGVATLVAHQRPRNRPFLLGFEVFGSMALVVYVILATSSRGEVVLDFYLEPFLRPIRETIGHNRRFILVPMLVSTAVVLLGSPQVFFALIGGSLSCRFRITITPR
jgi:hypothetical protein